MRMRVRLFAAAAAAVFASTGLAVMLTPSPASAATSYCTMKAVTNTTTYARAENYGYGGYGTCHSVQVRAWRDYCTYSVWSYGPISATASQIERGSSCSISSRGTRAAPIANHWTPYSTANGTFHRAVTT